MADVKIEVKVRKTMDRLFENKGYAAPVDVLIETGFLTQEKYIEWRNGKVSFLEKVCIGNLNKLSQVLKMIRSYALEKNARPSLSAYRQFGAKNNIKLRFSKSGDPHIEEAYSTHYVLKKDPEIRKTINKQNERLE